ISHVEGERVHVRGAERAQRRDFGLDPLHAPCGEQEPRALAREGAGAGTADAAAGPGDKGDAVRERGHDPPPGAEPSTGNRARRSLVQSLAAPSARGGRMSAMHEVDYRIVGDDMQFVEVELDPGEAAVAEAGGMMYMDDGIAMETIFGDGSG